MSISTKLIIKLVSDGTCLKLSRLLMEGGDSFTLSVLAQSTVFKGNVIFWCIPAKYPVLKRGLKHLKFNIEVITVQLITWHLYIHKTFFFLWGCEGYHLSPAPRRQEYISIAWTGCKSITGQHRDTEKAAMHAHPRAI